MTDARELAVVGYGMAAHRLIEALRARDSENRWRVTVLAEEPRPAYDRVTLSSYLDGATEADLRLPGADFAGDDMVRLRLGEAAAAIDRAKRLVRTSRGHTLRFDALVFATGSSPFVPPIRGAGLPGCFVYRTIEDLDNLRAAAERAVRAASGERVSSGGAGTAQRPAGPARGVVIGGGLLGLEAANALRLLGLVPHVVEIAPRLMPVQVDEGGGALLHRLVSQLGVGIHCGVASTEVQASADGRVAALVLADGTRLAADVVVFSAGVRPRDELARAAGLAVGERGGVVVDKACRTVDTDVYAIGECACIGGRVYGLAGPGYAMAEVTADRLLGGSAAFENADTSAKLKLLGVDVASFGDAHARSPGALEVVRGDPVAGTYAKLVVSDDARTLLGGVLVGDATQFATLRALTGRPLPSDPISLISPPGRETGAGVTALPGDALICSCLGVPKGVIDAAIEDAGCATIGSLKGCTKAGTGCGSCVPALKQLLAAAGVTQQKAMCEHFAYSRAELFEVAAATGMRSFSELVTARGKGRGCDICKPAVASILASLASADGSSRHILDGEQAALQDTNDHFLANIQRNGTYSVVPRIPGGEITPDKLMAIAQVARDFQLYTKITGGQRIDLFGARLDQLPAIWNRLIAAGFESGHAYGKALRTVKSCVGSTWCRYGVQDSVGLAIELELRYRGLRSPHKVKAAVSGCARECAEARGKDFGVIATEKGWNLYVGGNGGFRPRHADLLVADVGKTTLIRLIDRFLMFYVRTADRLQRTATWIEAMDGGLGHLRAVIVDDELGICDELEAAMERHIASYADEWRGVLEDPVKLARYVSYVNAPGAPDPSITFTVERGQRVPAGPGLPTPVQLGMPGRPPAAGVAAGGPSPGGERR